MQWTPQQDAALMAFKRWRADPSAGQVFRLFGYAGTGKTTMAKALAEDEGMPLFAAYTGKAAHVLRQKGCPATTIHSLIYRPKDKSREHLRELEGQLERLMRRLTAEQRERGTPELVRLTLDIEAERDNLARPAFSLNLESPVKDATLLVIDECSMVDGQMAQDLLSFGTRVLVLGDPAQLPPVFGGGYFTEGDGDVMLTDIQRQARDNPIIDLATRTREGERLEPGSYGESRVVARGERVDQELALRSQIIVGKNATRHAYNRHVRSLLGRGGDMPEPGDKLVCLRNNHDLGLLNGALWTVRSTIGLTGFVTMELENADDEDMPPVVVDAHPEPFRGDKVPTWTRRDAEEFDHGYALTCHKAQGSQWPEVMIKDESGVFKEDARRWLYTAITRASERVTILK